MNVEKDLEERLRQANPVTDQQAPQVDLNLNRIMRTGSGNIRPRFAKWQIATSAAALLIGAAVVSTSLPVDNGPLFSMSGTGAAKSLATTNGSAAEDSRMIMPMVNYEYFAGSELADFDFSETIYQFKASQPIEEAATELAKFFNLSEPQVNKTDPNFVFYQSGNYENGKPYLNVNQFGSVLSFDYSDPSSYLQPDCLKSDEFGCLEFKEIKADKSKLPTEAEAVDFMNSLAKVQGFNENDYRVTTSVDDWGMRAVLTLHLNNQPLPLETSAQWNQVGQLSYVNGVVGDLVEVKKIQSISSTDAALRANDYRWYGSAHQSLLSYPEFSSEVMPFATEADAGSEPASTDTPETKRIALTGAKAALLMVYASNSEMWLVPGFIFDSELGSVSVIATPDGLIELPEPLTPMVR